VVQDGAMQCTETEDYASFMFQQGKIFLNVAAALILINFIAKTRVLQFTWTLC